MTNVKRKLLDAFADSETNSTINSPKRCRTFTVDVKLKLFTEAKSSYLVHFGTFWKSR